MLTKSTDSIAINTKPETSFEQQQKKSYIAPLLVRFGDVRGLTQAGSINKVESGGHPTGRP